MKPAPPRNHAPPATPTRVSGNLLVYFVLTLLTVAIYWPIHNFEFVNYDDSDYVSANQIVQHGLSWANVRWAFTTDQASNWHPVTWLSHMFDCQLFGVKPGMHHLVNLFFHVTNTLLLFAFLKKITGARWRSVFVAALFALHPLHVESVAWISERKDVLSTFFLLLTMFAYHHYVKKPGFGNYSFVFVLFAIGLMAKPMLVTLPCALLLLDYWPLKRIQNFTGRIVWKLVLEKIPLLALSAGSSVATYFAQKSWGALSIDSQLSLSTRLENAALSYFGYLVKMFCPVGLAVPYPYPTGFPAWKVGLAVVFLCACTVCAIRLAKNRPYFLVGWFWYLGTLVPVIGIVQVGMQAMADRYTYIPFIGIFIVIAWGIKDLTESWPRRREVLAVGSAMILLACAAASFRQIRFWRNTETLLGHSARVTQGNFFAHYNLGNRFFALDRLEDAVANYEAALRAKPDYANAHNNLGNVLARLGRTNEATQHYAEALRLSGGAASRVNIANSLLSTGKIDEAIAQYTAALAREPNSPEAHNGLGVALAHKDNYTGAIAHFQNALGARPDFPDARGNLARTRNSFGLALAMQGKMDEAAQQFREALRIDPDNASVHGNLGNALATLGKLDEAIPSFETALKLNPNDAPTENNLATALASQGRLPEALGHYSTAVKLDPANAETQLNLALVLTKLDRRDEAITHLREALRLKPDYAAAQKQLETLTGTSQK